ncbi:GEVED domain-containing protein [Maribacter sp.]|uniref:immunoglobulin domain-containing protein n=1 Tax=Maribacter sp. TaxID=1897614 RepID=UPI0025B9607F|nr:GEVED domain-containing protein [Maribacter sp.]
MERNIKQQQFLGIVVFLFFGTGLFGQCPGPAPCPSGTFINNYEQINPSSIAGAVFCSGQTRTFTIQVGPGTATEASTGDIEYITLFFDFDCDGVFEYSVNDSCSYVNPGGCNVDLSVVAPTVTSPTMYNGRAHLVYNTPTTDPCANLPGGTPWGDIVDFTITVNLPPEPVLTSSDVDNTICDGDSVTFTATDGDAYEFYINGVSAQAQSTTATFTTSILNNGDEVTVRALDNVTGCDTFSAPITTTVLDPTIITEPSPKTIFAGDDVTFSSVINDVDTYQWQVSTNGGASYSNLSNGGSYSGVTTANLTIGNVEINKTDTLYRVQASNSLVSCPLVSIAALLTVKVRSVITNRRITHRVDKN